MCCVEALNRVVLRKMNEWETYNYTWRWEGNRLHFVPNDFFVMELCTRDEGHGFGEILIINKTSPDPSYTRQMFRLGKPALPG